MKQLCICIMLLLNFHCSSDQSVDYSEKSMTVEPQRPSGQKDVIELRTPKLDTVRIGIIGLGNRGKQAVRRLSYLENVQIAAISDIVPDKIESSLKILQDMEKTIPDTYNGADDWKKMCERDDIDLIYICTHWELHTPIAVYAMEQGKHAAIEVPAALTLDECWQLVNIAERTQRHCIQLENCIYDFFEITTFNMVQKGLLGKIVHAEGAYIHDLRKLNFSDTYYWDKWRIEHLKNSRGNLYPTHGLGPISHALNIHRGDRMSHLVSMSSDQFGMTEYAISKYGSNSEEAKAEYSKGDMNTTLIKTVKGKTILIQHDVTSPRPYSRLHLLSGTKGFVQKYPQKGISLESNGHSFLTQTQMDSLLLAYELPMIKEIKNKALEVGGHGGMDFIMDYRLVYCLRHGLPLDQDVYDAAEWSSIIELSKKSVENGSQPVKVPDFTRGAWSKLEKVTYHTE